MAAHRSNLAEAVQQMSVDQQTMFGCGHIARMLYKRGQANSVSLMAAFMRELGLPADSPQAYRVLPPTKVAMTTAGSASSGIHVHPASNPNAREHRSLAHESK